LKEEQYLRSRKNCKCNGCSGIVQHLYTLPIVSSAVWTNEPVILHGQVIGFQQCRNGVPYGPPNYFGIPQ
jgi:hypothetical protein